MEPTRRRVRPFSHRDPVTPARSFGVPSAADRRTEAGETLIEVLISVSLTGILVVAVIAGVFTSIKASVIQRKAATSEVVVRNFSAALTDTPYAACATAADYSNPPSFKAVDGYAVTVDSVVGWNKDSTPATFAPFSATTPAGADCAAKSDTGLQQVAYSVKATTGGTTQVRRHTMLKRFNGTIDDLGQPVPFGGVRCTISADMDTFLDEAAPDAVNGGDVTMDLLGQTDQRRQALLHFNLKADQSTCANGVKVPANMSVRSAALRLYTWQVTDGPNCDVACNHVLRRVTEKWSEASAWGTDGPPADIAEPTAKFSDGNGGGDYIPRYQTITGTTLNSDVSLFYNQAAANNGWSIERNCANGGCTSGPPGFRMRTREWSDVRQRPTLTVVFAPYDAPGKQLRNVASGACAWIGNGNYSNGQGLASLGCDGGREQLWVHPDATSDTGSAAGATEGQFGDFKQNYCIENGATPTAGTTAFIYDCTGSKHQKWDFDTLGTKTVPDPSGLFLKNRKDPSKCLAVSSLKRGSPIVVQTCNGSLEQQWVYEKPPTIVPIPDIRLTALKADKTTATGDCADLDLYLGSTGIDRNRWTQTYPCLGVSRASQSYNMSPDGRMASKQYPGFCLGFDQSIVAIEACKVGGGQKWSYEGTQLRNIQADKCITQFGGRRWLELQTCDGRVGQDWALDPAETAPSLATVVQYRNVKYGNCVEPDSNLTKGDGGLDETRTIYARTGSCGALDKPQQALVVLSTNELSFLSQPGMCLTSGGVDGVLTASACTRLTYDSGTPNNPQQQWVLDQATSQLKRAGTANCAQGNGDLQSAALKNCRTTSDANLADQQWSREAPGTATSDLRQMRNVGTSTNFTSCADLPSGVNGILWPCSGPGRTSQGVLLAKIGNQYEIRSASNLNQCVDVQNAGNDGAAVQVIGCNSGTYQRWTFVDGQLKTVSPNGRCLQADIDNAPLAMRNCANPVSNAQRWVFETPQDARLLSQIRNVKSSACLDATDGVSQGARLSGYPCVAQDRPTEVFVQLNSGAYASAASTSNFCIDAGYSNSANVVLWPCKNPVDSHQWTVNNTRFKQVGSGRCAEFDLSANSSIVRGCTTPPTTGADYQTWSVEPVGTVTSSFSTQFRSASTATDRANGCLDIAGATRSGYLNNDPLTVLPCLGTARTNQSFRVMSNGLIRSSGTDNECLDAGWKSGAAIRPVLYGCDSGKDDQRWKVDELGRIQNIASNVCVQGGVDGGRATMAACSTSPDQRWVAEGFGLNPRPDAVGRLRTSNADLCLETKGPQGNDPVTMWGWPCFDAGHTQQRFVRFNSGQYRPVDNLGFCLDANGGTENGIPVTNPCMQPADAGSAAQVWALVATTGWLKTPLSGRCLGAPGGGLAVRWQNCGVDGAGNATLPNQQWAFLPEVGL